MNFWEAVQWTFLVLAVTLILIPVFVRQVVSSARESWLKANRKEIDALLRMSKKTEERRKELENEEEQE